MTLKEFEFKLKDMTLENAIEAILKAEGLPPKSKEKLHEKYSKKKKQWDEEQKRYNAMCQYEHEAFQNGFHWIAGVDEVGRGPLAGPVVAASVILPKDIFLPGLNDSKKISASMRERLYALIIDQAISYGIGIENEACIDEINILNATKKAMQTAIHGLKTVPDLVLIDAVSLESVNLKQQAIIKGDTLSISIAAASIIAKVTRDRMMDALDIIYPQYGFAKHKGYGTQEHIHAIKKFGICPIHRISFTKNFM